MYHILSKLLLFLADDCEKATVLLEAIRYSFQYHKSQQFEVMMTFGFGICFSLSDQNFYGVLGRC